MKLRQRQVDLPISRQAARQMGLPRYFTGVECRNGHVAERYASNSMCTKCMKAANDAATASGLTAMRARNAYAVDPERIRDNQKRHYRNNKDEIYQRQIDNYYSVREVMKRRRYAEKNKEKLIERRKNNYPKYKHIYAENARRRQLFCVKATPSWADKKAIRRMYLEAIRLSEATGQKHHVDHIIPLRGRNVCGLHVEANLQVLPAEINRKKSNKWEGDHEAQS